MTPEERAVQITEGCDFDEGDVEGCVRAIARAIRETEAAKDLRIAALEAALRTLGRYVAIEGHAAEIFMDSEAAGRRVALAYDGSIIGPCADPAFEMYELAEAVEKWLKEETSKALSGDRSALDRLLAEAREGEYRNGRLFEFNLWEGIIRGEPIDAEAPIDVRNSASEIQDLLDAYAEAARDKLRQEWTRGATPFITKQVELTRECESLCTQLAEAREEGRNEGYPSGTYPSSARTGGHDELQRGPVPPQVSCLDCGAPYGEDGWCDVSIPNEAWNTICPEGGVLCFRCMTKRIEAAGLPDQPVIVSSGPYRDANEEWRLIGLRHGEKNGREERESLRAQLAEIRALVIPDDPTDTHEKLMTELRAWDEHASANIRTQGKVRELRAQLAERDKKIEELRTWVNCGGAPVGKQCSSKEEPGHEIYGPFHGRADGTFLCEFHSFREMIAERDAQLAEAQRGRDELNFALEGLDTKTGLELHTRADQLAAHVETLREVLMPFHQMRLSWDKNYERAHETHTIVLIGDGDFVLELEEHLDPVSKVLAQTPAASLAAHDAKVRAKALREAAQSCEETSEVVRSAAEPLNEDGSKEAYWQAIQDADHLAETALWLRDRADRIEQS